MEADEALDALEADESDCVEALDSLLLDDCEVRSSLLVELLDTSPSESSTHPCASRIRNSTASRAENPVK